MSISMIENAIDKAVKIAYQAVEVKTIKITYQNVLFLLIRCTSSPVGKHDLKG